MRSLLLLCLVATIFIHVSGHAYLKSPVQRTANVADDYKFFYGTVAAPNYGEPASAVNNRIQTLKTAVRDTCRPTVTQAQGFGDNGYTAANLGSPEGPYSNLTVGVPFDITWVTSLTHDSAPGITLRVDYNGGTNWTQIATNVAAGTSNGQVGTYSWTPTQASSHAVIQFIWESGADGGAYISCGDIRIAAASGTSTTAPPTSGTTTTPPSTPPSSSTGGKNAATIAAPTFTLMIAIIAAMYHAL